jgi:hypothetical protein
MKHNIKETAAAGSTGATSIAISPGRLGSEKPKTRNLKGFLAAYYDTKGKKFEMKKINLFKLFNEDNKVEVVASTHINETFNLDSVLAQLSSYENKTNVSDNEVTTYGVEDNKGNLMKVTVLDTEAEDFESYIAAYLSELKDFENEGVDLKDISLAELLYKLKDLFDIRDVEFPNIPDDTVYNADEASESVENADMAPEGDDMEGDMDMDADMGMEDDMEGDMEGDMGMDADMEGEMGDEEFGDEEGFSDDESVEDFADMEGEGSTESILTSIIDMLKKQAEAETAKANAQAEEARASQAESTARASESTLAQKEEYVAMDAEKKQQKDDEKAAKREADVATYRYKKSRGMMDNPDTPFEGFTSGSLLLGALLEEEEVMTNPGMVRRQINDNIQLLQQELENAFSSEEKRAIEGQIMALQRSLGIEIQKANAAKKRQDAINKNNADGRNNDPRNQDQNNRQVDPRAVDAAVSQLRASMNTESEEISEDQYEILDEAAKRQWKRYGNKFVRKFRCYGGPKNGKMVSTAAGCGMRKDPLKVRRGKKAARMKKGSRVRKTMMTKRKSPSKRLVRMNNILRGQKASRGQ